MPSKRTQDSRDAVTWVLSHLPDQSRFTTHEAYSLGDALMSQAWPRGLKAAWKRITGRVDNLGQFISKHPGYEKHPDGVADRSDRGVRIRTQIFRSTNRSD